MREIFVSPDGIDYSVNRENHFPAGAGAIDKPFRTLSAARDAVRTLRGNGEWDGGAVVTLRGGVYNVSEPVAFDSRDAAPVTYRSYPGERAVIDGGIVPEDVSESVRADGKRLWRIAVPKGSDVRSFFTSGERRTRSFLPKNGFYWMESLPGMSLGMPLFAPSDRFIAAPGDLDNISDLDGAEIHVFHYWVDEHMPVMSYDFTTRELISTHASVFALQDDACPRYAKYRVENIAEGLIEQGEWYFDRKASLLYYLPFDGETVENASPVIPRAEMLLSIDGASDLRFENIDFSHTEWSICEDDTAFNLHNTLGKPFASSPQAAAHVLGVISVENSERICFSGCRVSHIGSYAFDVRKACRDIRISSCAMDDLGAGGVKINGSADVYDKANQTSRVTVEDCDIGRGGRVFLAGIGVASLHAHHVTIAHNDIHDLYYTGVSCGWIWGYAPNVSHDNTIEKNHIWNLGFGVLSDMGGIYTLGVQPGTVVRGNLIHSIEKANYGGWAIYPDEGSSHITIEDNVCYDTSSSSFHQHYGRENIVRNNIFAFGREGGAMLSAVGESVSLTFEKNIVVTDGLPFHCGAYLRDRWESSVRSEANLYFDYSGANVYGAADYHLISETAVTLDDAHTNRSDMLSRVADPMFRDPKHGDFTLSPESPAFSLGFKPIDVSDAGVRKE